MRHTHTDRRTYADERFTLVTVVGVNKTIFVSQTSVIVVRPIILFVMTQTFVAFLVYCVRLPQHFVDFIRIHCRETTVLAIAHEC